VAVRGAKPEWQLCLLRREAKMPDALRESGGRKGSRLALVQRSDDPDFHPALPPRRSARRCSGELELACKEPAPVRAGARLALCWIVPSSAPTASHRGVLRVPPGCCMRSLATAPRSGPTAQSIPKESVGERHPIGRTGFRRCPSPGKLI